MPRRKQGHIKESAAGGCFKKRPDTSIILIQNESLKHYPTSNELLIKIKKTVPTNNYFPNGNEEIERVHLEASKSLNDITMVSQTEVNNNVIKHVRAQDANAKCRVEGENCCSGDYASRKECDENSNKMVCETTQNILKTNNFASTISDTGDRQQQITKQSGAVEQTSMQNQKHSQATKIPHSVSTINSSSPQSTLQNCDTSDNQKENSAKEGELLVMSDKRENYKTDVQPNSYRLSTSEDKGNHLKDAANSVLDQNSQLPSSVYGSPATNIERLLTGLQVPEKEGKGQGTVGKVSFLQEMLENKSIKRIPYSVSNFSVSEQHPDFTNANCPSSEVVISGGKNLHSRKASESKDGLRTDPTPHAKLALHIPDFSNDDSNSSILSTESQRTLKFPKITSPQILKQHISKIISENAAIVETLDPMWSRRYFKQTSQNNISSVGDGELKKVFSKTNRLNDERNSAQPAANLSKSKLHSALLGVCDETLNTSRVSNVPSNFIISKERNSETGKQLIDNTCSINNSSVSEDDLKGSAVKSLLSLKDGRYPQQKAFYCDKDLYSQHPQNPEGSIIKDLLLKSKSQEESEEGIKTSRYISLNASNIVGDLSNQGMSVFRCIQCFAEFSDKSNLDVHLPICEAKRFLSLSNSSEKLNQGESTSHSSRALEIQTALREKSSSNVSVNKCAAKGEHAPNNIGQILKQQLLLPRSPPVKRRKVSEVLSTDSLGLDIQDHYSEFVDNSCQNLPTKNLNYAEPYRGRSQSLHLFGGKVQVLDSTKNKKIKNKSTLPSAFSSIFPNEVTSMKKSHSVDDLGLKQGSSSPTSVIVTISQPGHNSGGTVHLPNENQTRVSSPIAIRAATETRHLSELNALNFCGFPQNNYLPDNPKQSSTSNLIYSTEAFPGPKSKIPVRPIPTYKSQELKPYPLAEELSPENLKITLSPGNSQPFYSPIFSVSEKSFELSATRKNAEDHKGVDLSMVPTVLFTPSSPTMPSVDSENMLTPSTSVSESPKKFLAPTRPTSLPLKKKPFTMVSSTLVSPETPRPKKNCVQLYLNGHAYTYLGLKCSTRSTYCCIYRPQPMFVLQETNPKLSMYSNWQVVPAKEELLGLTPGQMISHYCSRQRKDLKSINVNAQVGEPLIFTHSSYWTYRSQDSTEKKESETSYIDSKTDSKLPDNSESVQETPTEETSRSESVISSVRNSRNLSFCSTDNSLPSGDPENTLSDGENSNDEDDDDDDCQDDGTESLTDSGQGRPPKRVKIFEGGFKSNEDYTYVRGRGRGKYVCEECGIRCKKPSMLKKHIRTHTDLRPYKCRHCSFAFKTKGNLTKHMKSKAHHKKCTELGIIPVPTTTDDSQIDQEALAKQEQIKKKRAQLCGGEDIDDEEDEDTDDSEDDCESDASSMISSTAQSRMLPNGLSKKSDSQEKLNFESLDETLHDKEQMSQQTLEQDAVRSLLNLSAIGEPSQWSNSTADFTDAASCDTETSSVTMRSELSALSPSQLSSHNMSPTVLMSARSKNVSDQWLSTEVLGHRPRSYSADVPQSSGIDSLTKFKLARSMNPGNTVVSSVDETFELQPYARRYSISVAREARKPRDVNPPDWGRLNTAGVGSQKWPEGETLDQPMDLSTTRSLGKCRSIYTSMLPSSLMTIVTQEENVPEPNPAVHMDAFSDPYQLKSLPVLSPQVMVDYEVVSDNGNNDTPLLPLASEPVSFRSTTPTRTLYYVQDMNVVEDSLSRRDADMAEEPSSPDAGDCGACSPVSPTTLEETSYLYPQENTQASSVTEETAPTSRGRAEFIVPTSSSSSGMEEGKSVCRICNKVFSKSSHLRLHVNIHYFERPFRCDSCAVSFRTKGHLQKHKRSVSHYNKVNMNLTFGTPTVDNPRPFKCADCKIAFRIHGHLAKHLRSKMHIMKLECLGKLPFGMYAEMERSGISLNEIDTTDCNNSLESLQVMAQKLYQRDPRRMRWQGTETSPDGTCVMPTASVATTLIDAMNLPVAEPLPATFDSLSTTVGLPTSTLTSSVSEATVEPINTLSEAENICLTTSAYTNSNSAIPRYVLTQSSDPPGHEVVQRVEALSQSESTAALHRSGTCHICGRLFKSSKSLQVHLYQDHPTWNPAAANEPLASEVTISQANSQESVCDLCGKQFSNQATLQQHLLSHAQPRPFVCELCDAGFTSSSSLIAHKTTHQSTSSTSSNVERRTAQLN